MQVERVMTDLGGTDFGDDEAAMERYRVEGTARALEMDNRGSIRFDANGKLADRLADRFAKK